MSVLVVDDDIDIRSVLTDLLEGEGYLVTTAANGREALAYLGEQNSLPCLIVLDLMMPVMSGWQFLHERADDPVLSSVPVVVLSAVTELMKDRAPLNIVATLPKPYDSDVLISIVEQLCPH